MKSTTLGALIGAIITGIFSLILVSFKAQKGQIGNYTYHSLNEIVLYDIEELPLDTNTLFTGSGNCVLCHGDPDQFPSSWANRDSIGNDVSPISLWRASMMANSAKDPFWRAKVKHEGLENPTLVEEIETLCTTCHAPNGHFDAFHNGSQLYSIADLDFDPLGLDGVSCTSCHSMEEEGFGTSFSGNISYNSNHEIYGPYASPFQMPMINHTGFTPFYGSHISSSEACAKCHTLMTETIDESGELSGNFFPEQTIYHEWLNSSYVEDEIRCVDCHMPSAEESIKISPKPPWLDERSPYLKHELVGGNVFMLNVLKDNSVDLDLNASTAQFDDVIDRTMIMLQERALNMNVLSSQIDGDSVLIELELKNQSGHKLPSGYPSRKIMIEFLARSLSGDTLFHSGGFDQDGRIRGEEDDSYEIHYDIINDEDQVQLYEYVMGNESEEVTTILTRAYAALKDNRIPPVGFTSGHQSYDTIEVIGFADIDSNFNIENSEEGSGKDLVYYKIPLAGNSDAVLINVRVHYISIPRKWLDQLFEHSSEEITSFSEMYNNVDISSVVMKEVEFITGLNSIRELDELDVSVFPNPNQGEIEINSETGLISSVKVVDHLGSIVMDLKKCNSTHVTFSLPESAGNYLLIIELENGQLLTKSVVRL